MSEKDVKQLCELAIKAKENSYSPYSHFRVGAALLSGEGKIFTGCNIENAGFTATNCAERTAFFKAISEGTTDFRAIAISGDADDYLYPCGVCRQVMAEFCDDDFKIILAKNENEIKVYTLPEILPMRFGPTNLS